MKKGAFFLFVLFALLLNACDNKSYQHSKSPLRAKTEYQLVKNWPQLPAGFKLGNPVGIGIDLDQNIFVFHRADRQWPLLGKMPAWPISSKTIVLLHRQTGKILNSWGAGLFVMPHGLTVDDLNNIWVTDVGLHQVFKFSHDGLLLMTLGHANVAGNDSLHFNLPTDVAVAKDGSFYVSDGYGNSRIVKFSKAGKYLFQWGKKGNGPGEFNIPHAIDLDEKGNVYVADRENKRIQSFDAKGNFLQQWKDKSFGEIYSVAIDKVNNDVFAVDYITQYLFPKASNIILFDSLSNPAIVFGSGLDEEPVCRCHDIAIDNEQSIYVGDIRGNTIQKFTKRVQ
ncbi:MAG: peptidyl-alpha-hydroxyglycine alpha-amidating lyase family protein [Ferruginibacter sp.]